MFKNVPSEGDGRSPERFWMEEYMNDNNTTLEKFKTKTYFSLPEVRKHNIIMYFIKYKWDIISNYCTRDFINI